MTEEQLERYARLGRKLARQACPELSRNDSIPVQIIEGDTPPMVVGQRHGWTSKRTGLPIRDGRGYWRGGGWPVYHYSSRCVIVGYDWLAAALAAEIDRR